MDTQNDDKTQIEDPEHHRIISFGSETETWKGTGSFIGLITGLIVGFILFVFVQFRFIGGESLERLREQGGFATFLFFTLLTGFFGFLAGTLVGVGTPKYNPHPQQGHKRNRYV